jgi:hypothetical protein
VGNYAFLSPSLLDRPALTREEREALKEHGGRTLEAKWFVPLLWLALFEEGDVRPATDGGAPCLMKTREDALRVFGRRRATIETLAGPAFVDLVGAFAEVVEDEIGPWVLLTLDELHMLGPARFAERLHAALRAVGSLEEGGLTAGAQEVLDTFSFLGKSWQSSPNAATILAGGGYGWPPSPSDLAFKRAVAESSAKEAKAYAPSVALALGDRVVHATFGDGVVTRIVGARKAEVIFRAGTKTLAYGAPGAKAPEDPYGEGTPLGRYLRDPGDEGLWEACLEHLRERKDPRAEVMEQSRHAVRDTTQLPSGSFAHLAGPLARAVYPWVYKVRRGFLCWVRLESEDKALFGRPFLHTLPEALLGHPLWRTIREVDGPDADVIRVATHPNLVSLERVSLDPAGLSRLAAGGPTRVRAVTSRGDFGVVVDRPERWAAALEVGALGSLVDLSINLRVREHDRRGEPFLPGEIAWLLGSPLGARIEELTLASNGTLVVPVGEWAARLGAGAHAPRVWVYVFSEEGAIAWIGIERGPSGPAIRVLTDAPSGDALVEMLRPYLAGTLLPATIEHRSPRPPARPEELQADLERAIRPLVADLSFAPPVEAELSRSRAPLEG